MGYYTATRMNDLQVHATTWMDLTNNVAQKKPNTTHIVWFHVHKVKCRDSGYPWNVASGRSTERLLSCWWYSVSWSGVLGSMDIFSFWNVIKLYPYDIFIYLYAYYTSTEILKWVWRLSSTLKYIHICLNVQRMCFSPHLQAKWILKKDVLLLFYSFASSVAYF